MTDWQGVPTNLLFLYAVVRIASCTLKRLYMNIYDRIASI